LQGEVALSAFNWCLLPRGTETTYWQASQELKLDWQINHALKSQTGVIYFRREFPNIGQLTRYGPDPAPGFERARVWPFWTPVDPTLPQRTSASGWYLPRTPPTE